MLRTILLARQVHSYKRNVEVEKSVYEFADQNETESKVQPGTPKGKLFNGSIQ